MNSDFLSSCLAEWEKKAIYGLFCNFYMFLCTYVCISIQNFFFSECSYSDSFLTET